MLLPIACFAVAAALVVRRPDDVDAATRHGLRVTLGAVLVVLSVTGLWHVSAHRPTGLHNLEHAGGVVGAVTGGSFATVAGNVGATVVLGAALGFGLLLVLGLTLRQVVHAIALGCSWLAVQARSLVELGLDDEEGIDDVEPAVVSPRRARSSAPALIDLATPEVDEYAEVEDDDHYDLAEYDDVDFDALYEDDVVAAEYDDLDDGAGERDDDIVDAVASTDAEGVDLVGAELEGSDVDSAYRPKTWKLPPVTMLKRGSGKLVDERLIDAGGEVLEATLREFGVDARLIGRAIGPTVSRYELELAPGVKVNKVTNLAKEIAYAMASHDVRILAPIPGRSAIGVEVPNKVRPVITLGDILSSEEAAQATHPLQVGLGRDIAGRSTMANLAEFPHVLIAGQTGAGKSSCINSIVTSLLMRTTPDQVRLILVDPKRVEMGQYNSVPHLLTEVVVNPKKAANALEWAVREMDLRYDLLAEVGVRDITGYNAMWDRGDLPTNEHPDPLGDKTYERLPFIVIVVDELADLMMVAARDVENSIARLAQMARAVGIHLVIATQRPSVDVITGMIKANVPSRLAFAVSSLTDSRVILDQPGAEKLVGKGDMLMVSASSSKAERIQGSWVDEECVRKVVAHWRRQAVQPSYIDGVQGTEEVQGSFFEDDGDGDDLLEQAMDLVVRGQLGSTSMLQRKLRVGFARAGRIMDLLENRGVVGPSEGSKPRAVLMTVEELDEIQGRA